MDKKHPVIPFNLLEISRKVICSVLIGLLVVQSGCYTTRATQFLEQKDIKIGNPRLVNLRVGQLIRITYVENSSTKRQRGIVKHLSRSNIIISTKTKQNAQPKDIEFSFDKIKKIEVFNEKFDLAASILVGSFVVLVLAFISNFPTFNLPSYD